LIFYRAPGLVGSDSKRPIILFVLNRIVRLRDTSISLSQMHQQRQCFTPAPKWRDMLDTYCAAQRIALLSWGRIQAFAPSQLLVFDERSHGWLSFVARRSHTHRHTNTCCCSRQGAMRSSIKTQFGLPTGRSWTRWSWLVLLPV
jgi:hypothetical protein